MSDDYPPIMKEGDSYEKWRSELLKWCESTSMDLKRQALSVRSKLSGEAREIGLNLDAADLNKESGMNFLLEKLDANLRKERKNKWDIPAAGQQNQNNVRADSANKPDAPNMTAAERARQRAFELSAKLAKEGKYQTKPMSLLPSGRSNPVDQFKGGTNNQRFGGHATLPAKPPIPTPEVLKKDTGGYFAKMEINDLPARAFITRPSTPDLILKKTGCHAILRGRYMTPDEKRRLIVSGLQEQPLTLYLEADISAKVQVAVHKMMEVIRNYDKNPDYSSNNYGLTGNTNQQQNNQYIQDKLFVGLESINVQFNLKQKLLGDDGANFNYVTQQTGAKIFLRGKGSGYLEQNSGRESFEAMHIFISHPRQDGVDKTKQLCSSLLETVGKQYYDWEQQRNGNSLTDDAHNRLPQQFSNVTNGQQYNSNTPPMERCPPPGTMNTSYRAAPPPQDFYQRLQFNQYRPPPYSMDQQQQTGYRAFPPPRPDLRYPSSQFHQQDSTPSNHANNRYDDDKQSNDERRSRDYSNGRSREGNERRSSPNDRQSHSPNERRRRRSRSRSRSRSPPTDKSSSQRSSSRRSPERTKRKFSEEPKKRRKFSEDPKLLQASKKREVNPSIKPETSTRSKEDFSMPPPLPPSKIKKNNQSDDDGFSVPFPLPKQKSKPKPKSTSKVLQMGALGSLAAYDDDDSDED